MVQERDFNILSYHRHANHFRAYARGGPKEKLARSWLQDDTVDAWRHLRMYRVLDPLLEANPQASWLTCGDGRYGKDAQYIQKKGLCVLATDISDVLLREAKESGSLHAYKQENAEHLSFSDRSFDYVFCKESLHHFPRPMVALYEMLRVSSKGVMLIEPTDRATPLGVLAALIRPVWGLLTAVGGKKASEDSFEESGNYLYGISRREMEKVALGMNFKTVAFKGINDHYLQGVEFEKVGGQSRLYRKIKRVIALLDLLYRLKIRDCTLLAVILFKIPPQSPLRTALKDSGYHIRDLHLNPYSDLKGLQE